jgi:hypothetical protein
MDDSDIYPTVKLVKNSKMKNLVFTNVDPESMLILKLALHSKRAESEKD